MQGVGAKHGQDIGAASLNVHQCQEVLYCCEVDDENHMATFATKTQCASVDRGCFRGGTTALACARTHQNSGLLRAACIWRRSEDVRS